MAGTDPQLYTAQYISVNSKVLAEATQVQMQRTNNAQPSRTIAKGFAGITLGSLEASVTVSNAVPTADYELDAGPFIAAGTPVDISLISAGGKQAIFKGFITEDTNAFEVNGVTQYSFTVMGAMPQFK